MRNEPNIPEEWYTEILDGADIFEETEQIRTNLINAANINPTARREQVVSALLEDFEVDFD